MNPFKSQKWLVTERKSSLLQMKYILFVEENAAKYRRYKKCTKQFGLKIRLCRLGRNRFCTQAREKGAQWFAESNMIRVNNFHPTRPPSGSKNVILCFLANMRYIREDICTGYIRKRIYISVPPGKKDKKIFNQSINQPVWMPRLKRGGGKSIFSPNKDLGTRVGD